MSASQRRRSPSRWNGLSTEERQRERRRLLVASAFELLSEQGLDGTTVRSVCAASRLNPRYFYESFSDLDTLLVAVYDDTLRRLHAHVTPLLTKDLTEDEAMRVAVAGTIEFIDQDRRRGRVLYAEALGNEALSRRRYETSMTFVETVQLAPAGWREQGTDAEAGKVAAAITVGGFAEVLVAWLDGRIDIETDALVAQATRIFLGIRDAMREVGASTP